MNFLLIEKRFARLCDGTNGVHFVNFTTRKEN